MYQSSLFDNKLYNLMCCIFSDQKTMATFLQQYKTLMYKNYLYKKRNKRQLIQVLKVTYTYLL